MARSRTTWAPGKSGNPAGKPKAGEGIVKALADELNSKGQADKLSKVLVKKALDNKAEWRLQLEIFKYFFNVYQYEMDRDIETRLDAIENTLEKLCEQQKTS